MAQSRRRTGAKPTIRPGVRPAPTPAAVNGQPDGRVRAVVDRVRPEVDGGRFPIKRTVGESVQVSAWIHADGHDVLAAALRSREVAADGRGEWSETPMQLLGNDEWTGRFAIAGRRPHEYTVQAWINAFGSWRRGLTAKLGAGQDVSSELREGAALIRGAAERARASRAAGDARWLDGQADLVDGPAPAPQRARAAIDERLAGVVDRFPDRLHAAEYRVLPVSVDRERARFGAWYEMFPRSWGPDPARGATLREAEAHLSRVAELGFDVVYLPPIHPIGESFRKGRGNALTAAPGDPGSPWAIGSSAGGHKAVDPGLGTLKDFEHFVGEARRLGMEVALDLAYQCSPDHPYVREHPEWFRHRPDGTIKYAENPPKKYQDIYPFDFECDAWQALWTELKSVVEFWIARGVLIFRVDNPHTKPYRFWEWLIGDIRAQHPDVIFLAEAFTRPKVMYYLAKLGFTQSYTYFTWRNGKAELTDYFTELTTSPAVDVFRPNLFANTPDILHAYLQEGGPTAFRIRLILAATLGATYGIYSGFELCENRAVPGTEEYLDSEKYQIRHWDWDRPGHIRDLVAVVNRIRRENPALQSDRGLTFLETDNPNIIAFRKQSVEDASTIVVIVSLDHEHMQHGWVRVPLDPLSSDTDAYDVTDLLDAATYTWRGERNYVRFDPLVRVAHVLRLPPSAPPVVTQTSAALPQFLPRQRWFAGKARTIATARLVDWCDVGSTRETLTAAIAEVVYAGGGTERYFMPIAVLPDADAQTRTGSGTVGLSDAGVIVDVLGHDAACRALLTCMLEERSVPMHAGAIQAHAYGPTIAAARWPIVAGVAEQSNSCIVFGDRFVLKLLRRLEPGPNPEIEIARFLAQRGFAGIPPLAASLDYERDGEASTSLALLQEFVVNDGTAWERAVEAAGSFLRRETPAAVPFLASAATLGRRTAELHAALGSDPDDPAFAPEAITTEHVAALVAQLQHDAGQSLALLEQRLDSLAEPARETARAVIEQRARLGARIAALADLPGGSLRTRVHGDYHLGQVLCRGEDFVLIDFEGEPARSLAERRAKHSPLKDVAGMLRSFSYASYAALLQAPATDAAREASARRWAASVSGAFLKAYRETIAPAGLVPADDRAFDRLLAMFLLDKALYELQYELASRPRWVEIPLMGILEIARASDAPADAR